MPDRKQESLIRPEELIAYFAELPDPRSDINRRHNLVDLVTIAVCAATCGADEWTEVAEFGRIREEWFRQYLELPFGIPSHDTFGRVFALLDPQAFQESLLGWLTAVFDIKDAQVIAIDGKTARRSGDNRLGKKALHMVSAWATESSIVLGQVKTAEKSNEITAIPELLDMIDIEGATVTIDAMGCQREIVEKIIEKGGDYIIGLKRNQGNLHGRAVKLFEEVAGENFHCVRQRHKTTVEHGHGRTEVRDHTIIQDLFTSEQDEAWAGLRCFGRVVYQRTVDGKVNEEVRYYITSLPCAAKSFAERVRAHWSIENSLHWSLDVSFGEDSSRIRTGNAQENMNTLRKFTLSLLKNETSNKRGIKNKRKCAGWDPGYMLKVLGVEGK
jgi:predicted transposase YbfD/YdcC